jgi:hypothetical protein
VISIVVKFGTNGTDGGIIRCGKRIEEIEIRSLYHEFLMKSKVKNNILLLLAKKTF